jgi:hypothetical protein
MPIILVSWEAKIRRITVPGQPGQKNKFARFHLNRKSWAWYAPVIPVIVRSIK